MSTATEPLAVEQLYVISDLHLGGDSPKSQICNQSELLAGLVRHITEQAKKAAGRVVLVLAGDIVDFLLTDEQRDPAGYQPYLRAVTDAQSFLESVFRTFKEFFEALTLFLAYPNAELVCLLGNHDLELSYPQVWQLLDTRLTSIDHPRRGQLRKLHDGDTGFSCQVGPASVLCVHGNAVDPWNEVHYGTLRKVPTNSGDVPPPWKPNTGTALVVDVINALKREGYAFVDLLKPEVELVLSILMLALHDKRSVPEWKRFAQRMPALIPGYLTSGTRRLRRKLWRSIGLLGEDELPAHSSAGIGTGSDIGAPQRAEFVMPSAQHMQELDFVGDQLLEQARRDHAAGLEPGELVSAEAGELGLMKWATDRLQGRSPQEALREFLLDRLVEDQTFSITEYDSTYEQLFEWKRSRGLQPDFLIAGHTHLARAIECEDGSYYFNSGTWMQLIRFPLRMLSREQWFGRYYNALIKEHKSLPKLAEIPGLILNRPTVVRVIAEGNEAIGELCLVKSAGENSESVLLVPMQEFPFSVRGEDEK